MILCFFTGVFYAQNCNTLNADAGQDVVICLGESIQIGGNPTGEWNNSTNLITYSWTPNSNINDNTLANPTVSPTITATYEVIITSENDVGDICTESSTIEVTVMNPQANAVNPGPVCAGQSFTLDETGGDADSWVWSSNGSSTISNNTDQDPTITGAVDGEVFTVEITDSDGCAATSSTTVSVDPLPTVTLGSFSDICSNASAFPLTGGSPSGGTYSGPGVSGNEFDPAAANVGSNTITYTYTDGNGCSNSATQTITVLQSPDPSIWDYTSNIPFTGCGSGNFDLVLDNMTTTGTSNTNYTIDWGDGTSLYNNSNLPSTGTNHIYNDQGYFNLTITVTGQNGCIATENHSVFNGSNPAVGLGNPGSTVELCVPDSLIFPITGTSGNPPGTIYTLTTNTGDPSVTYNHPPPFDYTHVFSTTSCGATGGNTPNTYYVEIRAENPCGFSEATVQPITTSIKPIADIGVSPDTVVCVNSIITFTDLSINGITVDNFGTCDSTSKRKWEINPATGWSLQNGSLGASNPSNNPTTWGSSSIDVLFTLDGTYSTSMIIENDCGIDTMIKTVCIVPVPIPSFDLDTTIGCMPLAINTTNTSSSLTDCFPATYIWDVQQVVSSCGYPSSWNFTNGSDSSSVHPTFIINNPGQYVVSLQVINKCDSTGFSDTITVTGPPQLTLDPIIDFCGSASIQPIANIDSCLGSITAYQWNFVGGNPSSSSLVNPGSISYNQVGQYTVSLDVTNECGTASASEVFNVFDLPIITMPLDDSICLGESIQLVPTVSAGTPTYTYSWTPITGLSDNTILDPMASPSTTTNYILNVSDANNCAATDSILLEVLPLPIVNVIDQFVCQYDTAFLGGTISSGNTPYSYSWTPTGLLSGDQILDPYYVVVSTQVFTLAVTDQFNCSSSAPLNVTMFDLPIVDAGNDTTLCNQAGVVQFNGTPMGGLWTGTNITSSGGFDPTGVGLFENVYTFTDANGCINSDMMYIDVIDPTNADAGVDFEVCIDTGSVQLTGLPASGVWSGNGITPAGLYIVTTTGTFDFTYSFGAGNCLTNDVVSLIVNALPVVEAGLDFSVCVDAGIQTLNGTPINGVWTGVGITNSSGEFDPSLAGVGSHTVYYDYTNANTCDNVDSVVITVNELPAVDAGNDTTLCNQAGVVQFDGTPPPPGGLWTGTNITSSGGFDPTGVGLFENVYTFTDANGCINSDTMYIDVIDPTNADAGVDFEVCIDTGSVQLTGLPASGVWSGNGITPAGLYIVTTTGTFDFTYSFGAGNCLTNDVVSLIVNALPVVDAGLDFAVCVDAFLQTLTGNPVGGIWSGTAVTSSGDFDPSLAGVGLHSLYYSYTDVNTCDNIDSLEVTVNDLPTVDAGNDTTLCNQPIPINLSGTPSGGTWTGTNISGNGDFTPSGTPLGVGLFENIYTYTDPNGCVNSDTMTIEVIDPTNADAGVDFEVCVDTGSVQLTGLPANGVWTGNGITPAGLYNVTTAGTFDFTYSFGAGNCLTTDIVNLVVNDLPVVDAGNDISFCVDAASYSFVGNPTGGSWSGSIVTLSGDFDPSLAGVGLHMIYYNYSDVNTCDNIDSLVVTVNGLPTVDAGNDTILCNQPIPITLIGAPAGGNWSGSNVSINGDFTPSGTPLGVGLFENVYTYTDPNGCVNSDTMYIDVVDPINADAGADLSMCIDTGSVQLLGVPANGVWSGSGINSTGVFTPTIDGTFTLTYSYGAGNCLTSDVMDLIVYPLPIVNAGLDISLCVSHLDTILIASPTGGYWTGNGIIDSITGLFSPDSVGVGSSQIIYSYQNPSTYCWNYDTINILINPLPVPSFMYDSIVCMGSGVPFTNTTNGAVAYNWVFSDGGTSQLQDPVYVFNSTGLYNINLIAQSNFGCLDSVMNSIQVIEPPTALISLVDSGCAPLMVNYTNNSYGDYISFNWDLGNGVQSTDTIPQSLLYPQGVIADTTYYIALTVSNLCGVDSILDSVVVMPQPIAIFGTNVNIACSPAVFDFANNSLGLPDNYYWDFGNGNTSTSSDSVFQSTFYTGANDTTYTIMLVVDNECGSDTAYHTITVLPNQVNAFFNADTLSGCNPLTVNFTQYSTGALSYNWDLGDGNFSSLYSPTHTYTSAGTYTVSLAINDGCSYDTAFQSIIVHPIPTALFTILNDTLCGNQTFSFINQSLGTYSSYWEFGDGNSSTLTDPVHSYSSPGIYDVTLTITELVNGCENSYTDQVVSLIVPVASISSSPAYGCMPLFVDFINNSTNAQYYSWNFGDGNTSNNSNPVNTYLNAGNYYITLIAQNTNGCNDTASMNIDVYPIPVADFSMAYNDSCVLPASVSFTNNSTGAINYNWVFGDGGTAVSTGPVHYYQIDGQYSVQLTAENSYGCVDSINDIVIIDPIPIISFTTSPLFGCVPLVVDFTNTSQNGNFYNWDFGDGNVSTLPNVSNSYTDPGYYLATLTGEDLNGCSASSSVIITVYPEPVADFTYVNSDPCYPPVSVDFTNTSTGATNYSWDLDLGPLVSLTHPSIVYSLAGNYNIELIATSAYGCVDTAQTSIGVYDTPIASFFLPNDTICLRDSVFLTSQSSYADSLVWDFGNGDQAYGNDTSYYYENPGSYPITLYAYNTIGGCSDALTLNSNFVVLPSPIADFYFEDTYGENPYSGRLEFFNQSMFADSYFWDYEGWGSSTVENPIYYYQYPVEGTYTYTLYAYNDNGCLDSMIQELTVTFDKGLFIPNAMYPSHSVFKVANFMPQGIGLKEFHIMIFDTYGNFIWESNELDDEEGIPLGFWDGTLKGVPLKEDVYVWKVTKAVFKDNSFWKGKEYPEENKTTYTGTITLIR